MNGMPVIDFYMVRHGEAVHNLQPELINGQSRHAELSALGIIQAKRLGEGLRDIGLMPDMVLASPARRCRQTGSFCLAAMGYDIEPVLDERLLELSQGEWEGKPREEIYTEATIARIRREQMDFKAPGGQSINMVADQQRELFDELPGRLLKVPGNTDKKVVLGFGHGLATRVRAGKILGWTMDEMRRDITPNTSLTLFTYDAGGWGVKFVGKLLEEIESSTMNT